MFFLVRFEPVRGGETQATAWERTYVGLLPDVSLLVGPKVVGCRERLPTVVYFTL